MHNLGFLGMVIGGMVATQMVPVMVAILLQKSVKFDCKE